MPKIAARAPALLAATLLLQVGCSSKELYGAGQQWRRSECSRIDDRDERNRCERSAATSYESYKSQTDTARKP